MSIYRQLLEAKSDAEREAIVKDHFAALDALVEGRVYEESDGTLRIKGTFQVGPQDPDSAKGENELKLTMNVPAPEHSVFDKAVAESWVGTTTKLQGETVKIVAAEVVQGGRAIRITVEPTDRTFREPK